MTFVGTFSRSGRCSLLMWVSEFPEGRIGFISVSHTVLRDDELCQQMRDTCERQKWLLATEAMHERRYREWWFSGTSGPDFDGQCLDKALDFDGQCSSPVPPASIPLHSSQRRALTHRKETRYLPEGGKSVESLEGETPLSFRALQSWKNHRGAYSWTSKPSSLSNYLNVQAIACFVHRSLDFPPCSLLDSTSFPLRFCHHCPWSLNSYEEL